MFNRRVYYISGFDPRGARFYHRLFREESKKSCALSGAKIHTSQRHVIDEHVSQWTVNAIWNNEPYNTDYRFLTWDDIIKDYWVSSVWLLIFKSLPMYFDHIKTRQLPKLKKAGNVPYFCSILPLLYCSCSAVIVLLSTLLVFKLAFSIFGSLLFSTSLALIMIVYLLRYSKRLGDKIGIWWILQTYYFISRWIKSPLNALEVKTQIFADKIADDQMQDPVDEIIVVGHCVGTMVATSVVARVLNLNHAHLNNILKVVTLGQCIPYLSYASDAVHFRKALNAFANNDVFAWFDMGAKSDPLCFFDVNPAISDGVTLKNKTTPYRFTVRPYKMFSAEKFKVLKKNKLRLHFQYLMAADLKTDFDYFEITTGPIASINRYQLSR